MSETSRDLTDGYREGTADPVTVIEMVMQRIEQREPTLNAMWHVSDDTADQAEASKQRWADGKPLSHYDGVPVTVKENVSRAGVPMPSGTAAVAPKVPERNAPITDRLIEAGAIIVGSTVMPDWGMLSSGVSSLHGITRSPLDNALTTGGSSAGAGAAAAAGYGVAHVGTDIGGSIRLPGTWLGLATLKPSHGRVPLDVPYRGRCAGPIAQTVTELADMMAVIAKPDDRDVTQLPPDLAPWDVGGFDPSKVRIGLHTTAGCGFDPDSETAAAVEQAAEIFAAAGATVEPVAPYMTQQLLDDQDLFWRVRSLNDFKALSPDAQERVLPFIQQWVKAAEGVSAERLMECYGASLTIGAVANEAIAGYDFLLSPTAPMAAFPAEYPMPWGHDDQGMQHIGFTLGANMSGQPAGTVNCGHTSDGRTIGLHLVGHRFDDRGVLAAMAWFEENS